MAQKKLSALELKLKKLAQLAKAYTDAKASSDKVYLIEKANANNGYLKTYILARGVSTEAAVTANNKIGEINIPKDFIVRSGNVSTVTTAGTPYAGAVVGDKYIDLTINTVGDDGTATHIYIPVKDLVDVYTGSNAIAVGSNNVISLTLGANTNGMSITANGLELALATSSTAGAMSSADKSKLDNLYALLSDAELGSWFGYAADSEMVTTTLPAVSDDSITAA